VKVAELLMGARVEIEPSLSEDLDYDDSWRERRERPFGQSESKGVGESVRRTHFCAGYRTRRKDPAP
jgi:hypothetical protein